MRFILILLLFGFSRTATAQIQVFNRSLTDSTLPYLYIGVDNALEIDWKGLKPAEHQLSISGGGSSITIVGNNKYLMRATTATDECFLNISNKKGKTVLKKMFKVRPLQFEEVSLGGLRDSTATKERILATPFLILGCNECFYKPGIQIISFTLSVETGGNIIEVTASGNRLSGRQMELIKQTSGVIFIDNIRAATPDGRQRKLPSIIIHIKKEE